MVSGLLIVAGWVTPLAMYSRTAGFDAPIVSMSNVIFMFSLCRSGAVATAG
jgi:hypothetical protein